MMQLKFKGVDIDVCAACHGIWLDGDEVTKILTMEKAPRDHLVEFHRKMENLEASLESLEGVSKSEVNDLGATADALRFLSDAAGSIADALSAFDISL